ncbi:MAG TPA: SRPBCC family protein [Gemmatimonadales bacterium]|nr:SRPBCC family protein [Gemmatimonadales bacterium]
MRGGPGGRAGRWLRLWFSWQDPVDRRTYLLHGAGLMLVKYAVDAAAVWVLAGRGWTPLDYANPVWSLRERLLRDGPAWLAPALVVWTLPFVWIGVSMTLRRAVDAGRSPWLALLFFVPYLNYAVMLLLAALPSQPRPAGSAGPGPVGPIDSRLSAGLLGVAASLAITIPTVVIGVYVRRLYSAGLFLGTPFTIGYISAYVFNARRQQSMRETMQVAFLGVGIVAAAMLLFALEGAVCLALAFPLAALFAVPGAVLGRAVALHRAEPALGAGTVALVTPLIVLASPPQRAPLHEVITVVEIDAPPAAVWRHVVTFPQLPPPREWLFRAGVAAPTGARIDGTGVGATRYCDFTTGSFVEPVTVWEENRRLEFDIAAQAPPMRELSPYRQVNPPHLDGYFRATHGAFRLVPLPGGRTRLEGRPRYVVELFPQSYWTIPAGSIVGAIHARVLRHIKALAEEADHP